MTVLCHGSQSRITVDCIKNGRGPGTQPTRATQLTSIYRYLSVLTGIYLASWDDSQVGSIHSCSNNTIPANDINSEPSLHCALTVSNLPHFVAT